MILRTVRLENFGLYAGVTDLNLVPRRRQGGPSPIVLIGGKNGAGKTTLLEAVRLALYGRRALGARVGQSSYESYLRGRIHRGANEQAAAVALEFDYAEAGTVHRYQVRREWAVRGKSVVESLTLDKDGAVITTVPREEWHYFLQELIPPGVSQLFFFDGEKISDIADGENESEELAEAVRGLLGIELVGRLRTDLGLYLARHQRAEDGGLAARLESANRDIQVLQSRAQALAEQVADLTAARDSQARASEHIRRRFVAEGGDAAVERARTEAEREEVLRQIGRAEHELRDQANKLLPFAMAPRLVATFRTALTEAGASEDRSQMMTMLRDALLSWRAEGVPPRAASWSAKHWADLDQFVAAWGRQGGGDGQSCPAFREVGDGASALARLGEIESIVRPKAAALLDELDVLVRRSRELDGELARADNAAAGVILDELRLAEQRVGSTDATLKARQEELKGVRGQLVTLEREKGRLLEEQAVAAVAVERASLAARAARALVDYERRLLQQKLAQLRGEFVRRFNLLARKGDLIADIRIDPASFAATLIDRDGHELPKAALSAGEKQVYAIAMLWALARTSGRPLPMIIDTPLARLDSEHRSHLIERYFPSASHQVILLSTDTEVDARLLADLEDSVSHALRLDYDPVARRTIARPGYFDDRGRLDEVGHAL